MRRSRTGPGAWPAPPGAAPPGSAATGAPAAAGGFLIQRAEASAAASRQPASASRAARSPPRAVSAGRARAATPPPSGVAICRMPSAVPRWRRPNQAMTARPVAALEQEPSIPATTSAPASGQKPDAKAATASAPAAPVRPMTSTGRSPIRSVSRPHASSVTTTPALALASSTPVWVRPTPNRDCRAGPSASRPWLYAENAPWAPTPTASTSQRPRAAGSWVPALTPLRDELQWLGEVARRRVAVAAVDQLGLFGGADVLGLEAARAETAAARRADRARDVAAEHDVLALALLDGIGDGRGRHQRLGVRVHRSLVQLVAVADLHDLAEVHDRHPVGHLPHHRQVVRDRKSTRLKSSHITISYAAFCLKKKTGH